MFTVRRTVGDFPLSLQRTHRGKPSLWTEPVLHSVSSKELRPEGMNFWLYNGKYSRSIQIKSPGHSSLLTPNNQLLTSRWAAVWSVHWNKVLFVLIVVIIIIILLSILLLLFCCYCCCLPHAVCISKYWVIFVNVGLVFTVNWIVSYFYM